jgi:hypothetical protein
MPMGSDMFMYSLQAAGCRRYAGAWGVSRERGVQRKGLREIERR